MLSLARVLVEKPRLLIADELSLGLAPIIVDEVYETLAAIRESGTALLIVEQHVPARPRSVRPTSPCSTTGGSRGRARSTRPPTSSSATLFDREEDHTDGASRSSAGDHQRRRPVRHRSAALPHRASTSPSRPRCGPSTTPGSPSTTSTASPPIPGIGRSVRRCVGRRAPRCAAVLASTGATARLETSGQLGAVHKAVLAVAAGLARHVLVFRTVVEGSGGALRAGARGGMGGACRRRSSTSSPTASPRPPNWIACYAQRHMHDYGTTREQLGAIAINARTNAASNPQAIYTEPMTMDDYLAVRMISDPFGLYDCDVPCDGVDRRHRVASRLRARLPHTARSTSTRWAPRCGGRPSWDQFDDLTTMADARLGRVACGSAPSSPPADVDTAQLYDGFSLVDHGLDRGARLLREGRRRAVRRGRHPHRPRRRAAR